MPQASMTLFALKASLELGERIAQALECPLYPHEEREFSDGEHKTRPLDSVRGHDVYVIQSLYGDPAASVNDKLCRLLFFIGALKDAGAGRVTAIVPYLCYARKDQKSKPRDPVTTRYVASLFEAVGADRVVVIDVHNRAAFQNAFRCGAELLHAEPLFVDYFAARLRRRDPVVVSPDIGGVKGAAAFAEAMRKRTDRQIGIAVMEKYRSEGIVSGQTLAGDVDGKTAIILDDIISTGATILRAAAACREAGVGEIYAAATHGLFVAGSEKLFTDNLISGVVVSDTVPPFRLEPSLIKGKLDIVSTAPMVAELIGRLHGAASM